MSSNSVMQIKNLNLFIENAHILKNINVEIPKNCITAVIGPSGCGKTSLLRTMNRLIENTPGAIKDGEIIVDNENIFSPKVDISSLRRKIGLISQHPFLLPMSIFDNVAYGVKISGIKDKKQISEIVVSNLKEVSLWEEVKDRLHHSPHKLSIGQQQRLCLARGLAVKPEIILADEPTTSLDPLSTNAIENNFMALKNNYSIILVTHILRQARRLADYVIFMYNGEIVEHACADEFFNNPKEEKTKQYIQGLFY